MTYKDWYAIKTQPTNQPTTIYIYIRSVLQLLKEATHIFPIELILFLFQIIAEK